MFHFAGVLLKHFQRITSRNLRSLTSIGLPLLVPAAANKSDTGLFLSFSRPCHPYSLRLCHLRKSNLIRLPHGVARYTAYTDRLYQACCQQMKKITLKAPWLWSHDPFWIFPTIFSERLTIETSYLVLISKERQWMTSNPKLGMV